VPAAGFELPVDGLPCCFFRGHGHVPVVCALRIVYDGPGRVSIWFAEKTDQAMLASFAKHLAEKRP
jgi:hypothetical protein